VWFVHFAVEHVRDGQSPAEVHVAMHVPLPSQVVPPCSVQAVPAGA
jgi:hypothetical protein